MREGKSVKGHKFPNSNCITFLNQRSLFNSVLQCMRILSVLFEIQDSHCTDGVEYICDSCLGGSCSAVLQLFQNINLYLAMQGHTKAMYW